MGTDHSYRYVKIPDKPTQVVTGTFTLSTSTTTSINVGFKPDYLTVYRLYGDSSSGANPAVAVYNKDISTTQAWHIILGSPDKGEYYTIGSYSGNRGDNIVSLDSNGFTMAKASSSSWGNNGHYIAVKS